MKKFIMAGAALLTAMVAQPAMAAVFVLNVSTGSAGFNQTYTEADSPFTDEYQFTVGPDLAANGLVGTIEISGGADLDITGIKLVSAGGTVFDFTYSDPIPEPQVIFLPVSALTAGLQQLYITGRVAGDPGVGASYAGLVNLISVPEPATWAMMLAGFGAIGYSLRSRRKAFRLPQAV